MIPELCPTKNIHFIGVGGTGMSGLAMIMHSMGFKVSGSDMNINKVTEDLVNRGIHVFYVHNSANIPGDTQLVVKSAAIPDDNPEVYNSKAKNIPIVKYAQLLGYIMDLKKGIAVAGTHGKTTTTSMLAYIFSQANLYPGYVIGGVVPQLKGSSSEGKSDYFIVEACEFDRSFLNLRPFYAIINNIEEDHLDYYKNMDEILNAFNSFINNIQQGGTLFYSASSLNIKKILGANNNINKVSYGYETEADFTASNYKFDKNGMMTYTINTPDNKQFKVKLKLFGMHNLINSLAAFAVAYSAGVLPESILSGLETFEGVRRRFEIVYDNSYKIVDDYAHHPTEIKTVLKYARKKYKNNRIITVFQPHQHSRTRFLLNDFANSFSDADIIVVPDIYFVRDSEIEKKLISSRDLVRAIVKNKGNAFYIPSFVEIEKFLLDNIIEGDIIIFMGAGNINEIAFGMKKTITFDGDNKIESDKKIKQKACEI